MTVRCAQCGDEFEGTPKRRLCDRCRVLNHRRQVSQGKQKLRLLAGEQAGWKAASEVKRLALKTQAEVAAELNISVQSVQEHERRALQKMRTHPALIALKNGEDVEPSPRGELELQCDRSVGRWRELANLLAAEGLREESAEIFFEIEQFCAWRSGKNYELRITNDDNGTDGGRAVCADDRANGAHQPLTAPDAPGTDPGRKADEAVCLPPAVDPPRDLPDLRGGRVGETTDGQMT